MSRRETIEIQIDGNSRDAERAAERTSRAYRGLGTDLDRVDRSARSSGDGLGRVGAGLTRAAGVAAAGAVGLGIAAGAAYKLATAASDSAEAQSAASVVFGKAYGQIEKAAGSAARTVGLSNTEYLDAAKTFGVLGKAGGLTNTELATFSKRMVSAAGDMASFNNTSVDEAIQAIGSGLRGEAEPLRRFGILLDDATLRSQALKMGLTSTTKDALTPQQKVLAAQAVILAQLGPATGDFARTSGGLANQQRILSAQVKDAAAQLGTNLLPAAGRLVTWANSAIPRITAVAGTLKGNLSASSRVAGTAVGVLTGKVSAEAAAERVAASTSRGLGVVLTRLGLNARATGTAQQALRTATGVATQYLRTLGNVARSLYDGALKGLRSMVSNVRTELNRNPAALRGFANAMNIAAGVARGLMRAAQVLGRAVGVQIRASLGIATAAMRGTIIVVGQVQRAFEAAARGVSWAVDRIRSAASAASRAVSAVRGFFGSAATGGPLGPVLAYAHTGTPTDPRTRARMAQAALGDPLPLSSLSNAASWKPSAAPTIIQIKVEGALDPVSVAEQIRRILRSDIARTGRAVA